MKKRFLSGIKPTGNLTLGNYIGAIKSFIKLQDEYESIVFVADLHALTTGMVNPKELYEARKSIIAMYLSCGLNPNKTILFYQSDVVEHTMLQWLCASETTIGELSRMTQFKDKSQKLKQNNGTEKIPTGLLMYPTLMAADILLYNPDLVPIGEDQKQHLELTRNIAQRFNKNYKTNFKIPNGFIPEVGARIKSLTNPEQKMSKSEKSSEKSVIYLLEDPNSAYNKIIKSVTDSENRVYISENKPGILNLLNIYAALNDLSLKETENKFKDANYKEFKEAVALSVKNLLEKIQEKYKYTLEQVDNIAQEGALKAKSIAQPILDSLLSKMGFNGGKNESK
ncbi:tryptophan--tRNA ligase [Mycoplasmopsis felis]|uniref:tryptophan--tRNA ligase n=1 Tax=Mycoplasmopsis felis TaxID=33923 RepID=UPI002AFF1469|nr:tryptophan--tRNA ligase [Mycoplasmopsis felis]WQQ06900.1 tryptophan--tRNA ligase [Mycoplasmopsis felis]WQQ10787.1 tryptophan--tRNA ligase [Mycoplasmopsis felis]